MSLATTNTNSTSIHIESLYFYAVTLLLFIETVLFFISCGRLSSLNPFRVFPSPFFRVLRVIFSQPLLMSLFVFSSRCYNSIWVLLFINAPIFSSLLFVSCHKNTASNQRTALTQHAGERQLGVIIACATKLHEQMLPIRLVEDALQELCLQGKAGDQGWCQ